MKNSNTENTINLRCHHLLCIYHFKGEGYSTDFTNNMRSTINSLITNKSVRIVEGVNDALCSFCPNNINGKCKSYNKVKEYDDKVKNILNLEYNQIYDYNEIQTQAINKILSKKEVFDSICMNCEWNKICHK